MKTGHFVWPVGLAVLAWFAPLAVAAIPAADWVAVKDPHGFEVSLPGNWSARVLSTGSVVFSPEAETLLGPQAFVWVIHLEREKPAAEIAQALVKSYKEALPDFTAEGPHQLSGSLADSCSMRGIFQLLGAGWEYVFVVSAKGKVATLTGYASPADQCRALKPVFARVLSSFKPDAGLRDPTRIAPAAAEWVEWKDPREDAFTARVPKGWTVEGGTVRPYIDAGRTVTLKKGGRDSTSMAFLAPAPPLFTEPIQALALGGFREGSAYNPSGGVAQSMIVMRYLGARGYIERWLAPQVTKTYPDAKLVSIRERPDFAKGQPPAPGMQTTYQGAECEMALTVGGVKVRGRAYVLATRLAMPGMGGLWHATLGMVNAPPNEFDQALDIFWRVRDSFLVNPQWAAEEARQVMIRSKIIAASHDDISRTIRQSYETRGRAMDEISRRWSNAILGRVDLAHPQTSDTRYGVPSGSNHYWELAGKVIGTETYTSPGIGALELKSLDDVIKR